MTERPAEGYVQVKVGSRWPADWPTDGTIVHIVREDGTLRPLTRRQQMAIDFLLANEDVGIREAGAAVNLAHSSVWEAIHLVGLERHVTWRLPRGE